MASSLPILWIITDDRPGNQTQLIGIAEQLPWPYQLKIIQYNALAKLPNWLLGKSLWSLTKESKTLFTPPYPDIILSIGRRSVPVARFLKQQSPSLLWVHCMWPGNTGTKEMTLLVVPEHDAIPMRDNLIVTMGSPHRVTASLLEKAKAEWLHQFQTLPSPLIGVLLGGAVKGKKNAEETLLQALREIIEQASMQGAGLLVTTSRRTPNIIKEFLKQPQACPIYLYQWGDPTKNPYLGILACADYLVVTGDSMSMCSEACATGKPVYIMDTPTLSTPKHRRFHQSLYHQRRARPFTGNSFETWPIVPLNVTTQVAEAIQVCWNKSGLLRDGIVTE